MKTITVFTPTYNRGHLLVDAYKSLLAQTVKDFLWLIIDDGSTDDTKSIVESFQKEGCINIKYVYQENHGQYWAHNTALKNAEGELLAFLDSDDVYTPNAIERILFYYNQIKEDDDFAGVAGLKADKSGKVVGGKVDYDVLDCSILDYRYRYHYKGDKLECFKLKDARLYPFPEFNGKYAPNALIWNRISSSKKLRYFAEIVHLYDWSEDSMSRTIIKNRRSTPDAYLLYYSELSNYDIPLWYKIRSAINYWRFAPCSSKGLLEKLRGINLWKSILGLPLGILCYVHDTFVKE